MLIVQMNYPKAVEGFCIVWVRLEGQLESVSLLVVIPLVAQKQSFSRISWRTSGIVLERLVVILHGVSILPMLEMDGPNRVKRRSKSGIKLNDCGEIRQCLFAFPL